MCVKHSSCISWSHMVTASVIMELLDEWHQEGYKPMMPSNDKDRAEYGQLARLEREYVHFFQ